MSQSREKRLQLRAEYFANYAGADPDVRAFRRDIIDEAKGGKGDPNAELSAVNVGTVSAALCESPDFATVSEDEAREFLQSPAVFILTPQEFAHLGVPIFAHRSRYVWGGTEQIAFELESSERDPFLRVIDLSEKDRVDGYELDTFKIQPQPKQLPIAGDSVGNRLVQVAKSLCRRLPWTTEAAAWFVLTGTPPVPDLVEYDLRSLSWNDPPYTIGCVILTIDPFASPAEVASHYARARDELLVAGPRRADDKTLEIFRFVSAQRVEHPGATWSDLVDAWDRTCRSDWRFNGDEKAFRTYWQRGFRNVFPEMNQAYNLEEE